MATWSELAPLVGRERELSLLEDAERGRDRLRDKAAVLDRCQLHKPDAVVVRIDKAIGDFQREARLSNATRARERDKSVGAEELADQDELARTPDETGKSEWQIVLAGQSTGRHQPIRAPSHGHTPGDPPEF